MCYWAGTLFERHALSPLDAGFVLHCNRRAKESGNGQLACPNNGGWIETSAIVDQKTGENSATPPNI